MEQSNFDKRNLAVITSTFYPDNDDSLVRIYYDQKSQGMGSGRRESIERALEENPHAILFAEPEKDKLVKSLDSMFLPLINKEADLVVGYRKDRSSYPSFQQETEGMGNARWEKLTGTKLDMFFGPRAWLADCSHYFLKYNGVREDSLHIPVLDFIYDNKRIKSVEIDFKYPKEQKEFEEANSKKFIEKRKNQLDFLTNLAEEHWKQLNIQK